MGRHLCACFYSSAGTCVYCGSREPDKAFTSIPGVQALPPANHVGNTSGTLPFHGDKFAIRYVPRTQWGREQVRRSLLELAPDLAKELQDDTATKLLVALQAVLNG